MKYKNIRLKKETYDRLEKIRWLRRDKCIDDTVKCLLDFYIKGGKNK